MSLMSSVALGIFAAFSRLSCSTSRLLSARLLKLPQRAWDGGIGVFLTQLPLANWKKSSQASAVVSIRLTSKAFVWAIALSVNEYRTSAAVRKRKSLLRIFLLLAPELSSYVLLIFNKNFTAAKPI